LDNRKGIRPVKNMWDGGGGHCLVWMESRSSLLALAHPGGLRKRAVKQLWCGFKIQLILMKKKTKILKGMLFSLHTNN